MNKEPHETTDNGHDKFSEQAISEFVFSELCDFDDESGRYFREDTVISLIKTNLSEIKANDNS